MFAGVAMASDGHPVPLKDRLKWELWTKGLTEFETPARPEDQPLPETLERVLNKLGL